MTVVDDDARAVLALTNRLVDVGVPALRASELWQLLSDVESPGALVGQPASAIAGHLGPGVEADRVATLLDAGISLAVRLDALAERGIWTVTPFDDGYPQRLRDRLGRAAPPVLYGVGPVGLLGDDGIGIVGSRDVDSAGADVAREAARHAARTGMATVSGGARGVDQISMAAAEEVEGTVVGVLAESLVKRSGSADVRRAVLEGRVCLCTPYHPEARFSVGTAMGRNKVIYGLSRVTLVVASAAGSGGTWSGALEAIEKGYGIVAVWRGQGEGEGNDAIAQRGATPVRAVEELDGLGPVVASGPEPAQLSLVDAPAPSADAADDADDSADVASEDRA